MGRKKGSKKSARKEYRKSSAYLKKGSKKK